jgi:hypothetical protein
VSGAGHVIDKLIDSDPRQSIPLLTYQLAATPSLGKKSNFKIQISAAMRLWLHEFMPGSHCPFS